MIYFLQSLILELGYWGGIIFQYWGGIIFQFHLSSLYGLRSLGYLNNKHSSKIKSCHNLQIRTISNQNVEDYLLTIVDVVKASPKFTSSSKWWQIGWHDPPTYSRLLIRKKFAVNSLYTFKGWKVFCTNTTPCIACNF